MHTRTPKYAYHNLNCFIAPLIRSSTHRAFKTFGFQTAPDVFCVTLPYLPNFEHTSFAVGQLYVLLLNLSNTGYMLAENLDQLRPQTMYNFPDLGHVARASGNSTVISACSIPCNNIGQHARNRILQKTAATTMNRVCAGQETQCAHRARRKQICAMCETLPLCGRCVRTSGNAHVKIECDAGACNPPKWLCTC